MRRFGNQAILGGRLESGFALRDISEIFEVHADESRFRFACRHMGQKRRILPRSLRASVGHEYEFEIDRFGRAARRAVQAAPQRIGWIGDLSAQLREHRVLEEVGRVDDLRVGTGEPAKRNRRTSQERASHYGTPQGRADARDRQNGSDNHDGHEGQKQSAIKDRSMIQKPERRMKSVATYGRQ